MLAAETRTPRTRAKPRQREKAEQAGIVRLLESLQAHVYILGSRRAQRCRSCGAVTTDQGTRQTPGLADLYAILRPPQYAPTDGVPAYTPVALWIEVKAGDGQPSSEQRDFMARNASAGVAHLIGGVDVVIAFLVRHGWLRADGVASYRAISSPAAPPDAAGGRKYNPTAKS